MVESWVREFLSVKLMQEKEVCFLTFTWASLSREIEATRSRDRTKSELWRDCADGVD